MLLRALKDLDNEKAIGKLEVDDYEPIAAQYRAELKVVLARIDEQLAPNRVLAEEAATEYLAKAGIGGGYRNLPKAEPTADEKPSAPRPLDAVEKKQVEAPQRIDCPKCNAKNEHDAKFCKECATKLTKAESENADA
jgi:ribosomal protein L40E